MGSPLSSSSSRSGVALSPSRYCAAVRSTCEYCGAPWVSELQTQTDLTAADIGRLGGGRDDDWTGRRVIVAVLNTAARKLPDLCRDVPSESLMLVVDECHRA